MAERKQIIMIAIKQEKYKKITTLANLPYIALNFVDEFRTINKLLHTAQHILTERTELKCIFTLKKYIIFKQKNF